MKKFYLYFVCSAKYSWELPTATYWVIKKQELSLISAHTNHMNIYAPEKEAGSVLNVNLGKVQTIMRKLSMEFPIKCIFLLINASMYVILFLLRVTPYQRQFQVSACSFIPSQNQTTLPIN